MVGYRVTVKARVKQKTSPRLRPAFLSNTMMWTKIFTALDADDLERSLLEILTSFDRENVEIVEWHVRECWCDFRSPHPIINDQLLNERLFYL